MSDLQRPRNLESSFTATGPRQWKVVGGDRVGTCTFCGGGPTEAVVGCPDDGARSLASRGLWALFSRHGHDAVRRRQTPAHRGAGERHERGSGCDRQASRSCPMEQPRPRRTARRGARDPRKVRTASRHAASRHQSPGITPAVIQRHARPGRTGAPAAARAPAPLAISLVGAPR